MKEFPEIKTKRLLLSQLKLRDVPEIVKQANNKKIADMTINIPYPYLKKDALHWVHTSNQNFIENTAITFKISLKKTNEFIGGIGLTMGTTLSQAELGFWIAEDFWNQGYATEASSAVLHFGFKVLGINKIYATHFVGNISSGKVMTKCGMEKEAELSKFIEKQERFRILIQYATTKAKYLKNNTVNKI